MAQRNHDQRQKVDQYESPVEHTGQRQFGIIGFGVVELRLQAERTNPQHIRLQVALADGREGQRRRWILREHESVIGVVTRIAFGPGIRLLDRGEIANLFGLHPLDRGTLVLDLGDTGPDGRAREHEQQNKREQIASRAKQEAQFSRPDGRCSLSHRADLPIRRTATNASPPSATSHPSKTAKGQTRLRGRSKGSGAS